LSDSYRVDTASDVPPSRQLVEAILDALACGALEAGAKLLSVRALAAEALVNPNTAARAYRDLEQMGVVSGRNGLGVFVTGRGPSIARAARRKSTLQAFRRAAAEALRAGHPRRVLLEVLRDPRPTKRSER
jgi:DNA-binding transcriptional regulator YhcF (GntR family)